MHQATVTLTHKGLSIPHPRSVPGCQGWDCRTTCEARSPALIQEQQTPSAPVRLAGITWPGGVHPVMVNRLALSVTQEASAMCYPALLLDVEHKTPLLQQHEANTTVQPDSPCKWEQTSGSSTCLASSLRLMGQERAAKRAVKPQRCNTHKAAVAGQTEQHKGHCLQLGQNCAV